VDRYYCEHVNIFLIQRFLYSLDQRKHRNVFLSLSTTINGRSPSQLKSLVAACADDRILAESDIDDVNHCTQRTWDIMLIIADVKGWAVENEWDTSWSDSIEAERTGATWGVVRRLKANWRTFSGT
jgi:hypothetical protein